MSYSVKTKAITLLTFLAGLYAISYTACNKGDNTTATTIVKCVTCANGGQCINDTCRCPSGYEGLGCQTLSIQNFISGWEVTEKGSTSVSSQTYFLEITENFGSVTTVTISELNNEIDAQGTVSGDTLYIPSQTVNEYTVVGVGYIHSGGTFGANGAITMRYQVTNTITGVVNDFGYSSPNDSPSQWIKD